MADDDRIFWSVYERLSLDGICDTPGGSESRRVFDEWVAAGRPRHIGNFIRQQAGGPL